MSKKTYSYRKGGSGHGVPAQVVGEELARITTERGGLSPADVVEEARPAAAPLHPAFEWDDSVAGENYRRWQARALIRAVEVVYADKPAAPRAVYVHVPASASEEPDAAPAYQPVEVVVRNRCMYAAALGNLKRNLASARRSAEELQHMAAEAENEDARAARRVATATVDAIGVAERAMEEMDV